jgi:hypothetical protein
MVVSAYATHQYMDTSMVWFIVMPLKMFIVMPLKMFAWHALGNYGNFECSNTSLGAAPLSV